MPFWKSVSGLDRKFSWSFMGFVIAIVLAGFTIYKEFIADKNPRLLLDVITSASVLDVREDVPKLEILFDGIDIRKQKLSLRILSVKVVNDSSKDILKGHYDSDDPVGMRSSSGRIIRAEVTDASNQYLRKTLSISTSPENLLYFKDVILESHQYFVIKLLILHPLDEVPSIKAVGHVAGIKEIKVKESYKEQTKVQPRKPIIRPWLFLVFIVLGFLVVIVIGVSIQIVQERKRKKLVIAFKATSKYALNDNDEFILEKYVKGGRQSFMAMCTIVKDDESLNRAYLRYEVLGDKKKSAERTAKKVVHPNEAVRDFNTDSYGFLFNFGFIKIVEEHPSIDSHAKETIETFFRFLVDNKVIKQSA